MSQINIFSNSQEEFYSRNEIPVTEIPDSMFEEDIISERNAIIKGDYKEDLVSYLPLDAEANFFPFEVGYSSEIMSFKKEKDTVSEDGKNSKSTNEDSSSCEGNSEM
jgi:hypothetical protein